MIGHPRLPRFAPALGLLALAAGGPTQAQPQPGTLDPDFNGSGTVTHEVGGEDAGEGRAVTILGNGSLVVIGRVLTYSPFPPPRRGTITRFNPDGSLASSVSHVWFGCGETMRGYFAGVRLADGQYIAAGTRQDSCGGTPRHFDIALIQANGGVATNFDPAVFSNQSATAMSVAVQPDGKIVSAGWASTNASDLSSYDAAIARHHADGTLDLDFGTNGEATFDIDGGRDSFESVALQPDGKIVIGGFATTANGRDFLIMRLHPDGSVDQDFGSDGRVLIDFNGFDDTLWALALQVGGRIVVAGQSTAVDGMALRLTTVRLLADGTIDDSFADNGVALIDFGTASAGARAMTLDGSGRIYLAGFVRTVFNDPNTSSAAFAVLRSDGTPDTAFDNDGQLIFSFNEEPYELALGIAVDPASGRIGVSGLSGEFDAVNSRAFARMAAARLIGIPNQVFADGFEAD